MSGVFDAADVTCDGVGELSSLGCVIYCAEPRPPWWRWRQRRSWFPPLWVMPSMPSPEGQDFLEVHWAGPTSEEVS